MLSFHNKFRVCSPIWDCSWCRARTTHRFESYDDGLLTPAAVDSRQRIIATSLYGRLLSRLPADRVLFEVGVHGAAYGGIEVCGAEAIK